MQKFVDQGWVEVRRDGNDARNKPVRITAEGLARLTAMQRSFGPVFAQLLGGWEEADLERLIADPTRLTARLTALNEAERKRP